MLLALPNNINKVIDLKMEFSFIPPSQIIYKEFNQVYLLNDIIKISKLYRHYNIGSNIKFNDNKYSL